MPLGIPINRQSGGAWANVGDPNFTRNQMAMGQQDVGWAQQMDMFYANLEQSEAQFEESLAESTRQYDLGFGAREREFDIGQENWLKAFGLSEEQWAERKKQMEDDDRLRDRDFLWSAEDRERREEDRLEAEREAQRIATMGRGRPAMRRLGTGVKRGLRGRLPSATGRGGGGGRSVRFKYPSQSLSDKMASFSATSGLSDLIRTQKKGVEEGRRSAFPTSYGPTTPSYNAPWESYQSPTELGTAPDYGFGDDEDLYGPEYAQY